jgi:hypothetical protein
MGFAKLSLQLAARNSSAACIESTLHLFFVFLKVAECVQVINACQLAMLLIRSSFMAVWTEHHWTHCALHAKKIFVQKIH